MTTTLHRSSFPLGYDYFYALVIQEYLYYAQARHIYIYIEYRLHVK